MTNALFPPCAAEPVGDQSSYPRRVNYTGYVAPGGIADYYDSGIETWLHDDLTEGYDSLWNNTERLRLLYQNYLIGIAFDDGHQMNGFGAGPDFVTTPGGYNNYNLGMQVAAMSPLETANSS